MIHSVAPRAWDLVMLGMNALCICDVRIQVKRPVVLSGVRERELSAQCSVKETDVYEHGGIR